MTGGAMLQPAALPGADVPGAGKATLDALYRAVLVVSLPGGLFVFFLPLYAQALGASAREIGQLFAVFALAPVLARPLVGRGVDRYGRRPFILAGPVCFAVAWALYAASTGVALLFVARVVEGAALALLLIAVYAALADLVPPEGRGAAVGRVQSAINLGAFLGGGVAFPLLFLGDQLGWDVVTPWRLAFGLYAVAMLALLPSLVRRVVEPPRAARTAEPATAAGQGRGRVALPSLMAISCAT